jgi:hypothetical protein
MRVGGIGLTTVETVESRGFCGRCAAFDSHPDCLRNSKKES